MTTFRAKNRKKTCENERLLCTFESLAMFNMSIYHSRDKTCNRPILTRNIFTDKLTKILDAEQIKAKMKLSEKKSRNKMLVF